MIPAVAWRELHIKCDIQIGQATVECGSAYAKQACSSGAISLGLLEGDPILSHPETPEKQRERQWGIAFGIIFASFLSGSVVAMSAMVHVL
jgi:hypothetical protein